MLETHVLQKHKFSFRNYPNVDDKKTQKIKQSKFVFSFLGLNVADDLPLYQPQQRRVAAPEYYAQDGKTPIYKVFKRNPYGRR